MNNTDRIRELLELIHDAEQGLEGLRAELARLRLELRRLVAQRATRGQSPFKLTGHLGLQSVPADGFQKDTKT